MEFALWKKRITRPIQIEALVPYLDHLSELDIYHLWEECNDRGWFELSGSTWIDA